MVLFINVNVGQRVEVQWKGRILKGTVKFKGCLNGVPGDWVGLALDNRAGRHDGMISGRRYFQCMPGHGIFTVASKLRFISMKRCLYNSYRTVERESIVEDELFGQTQRQEPELNSWIDPYYEDKTRSSAFPETPSPFSAPRDFTLRHSIGNSLPAATMLRPETARSQYCYRSTPIHWEYENDADDFIRSPSIPLIHMPHTALKKQIRRGWDNTPLVRYMSVNTGRDSIKFSQWNDISA